MSIQLTPQQQQAMDAQGSSCPRVVDPRTNRAFVLVPEGDYEEIRDLLKEEHERKAIHHAALRNAVGRMEEEP